MGKSPWQQAFEQGYICAVANIIRTHDAPTIAEDVLACQTPDDWSKVNDYDYKTLRAAGLAPAKRKPAKRRASSSQGERDE